MSNIPINSFAGMTCKFCGEDHPYLNPNRKFCSKGCYYRYLKTRTGDKNPAWKPLDLKRPNRTIKTTLRNYLLSTRKACENCGNNNVLEIHHIDHNRENNSLENLQVLCLKCHANKHVGEKAYHLILNNKHKHEKLSAKNCLYCNKTFYPYGKEQKFCSSSCSRRFVVGAPKTKICQKCGKKFSGKRANKFCSRSCSNKRNL